MSHWNQLFHKSWLVDEPKAVVGLVHGLGEHIMRYEHVANFFNKHQIAVLGFDRIGHGQSPGTRGDAPTYSSLLEEIDGLIAWAETDLPDVPLFIYGHSMGGQLVLMHQISRGHNIQGLISSAPVIGIPFPPNMIMKNLLLFLEKFWPSLIQDNGLQLKYLSKDKAVRDAYLADPLVHTKISLRIGVGLFDGMSVLKAFSGNIGVPLYLLHGAKDGITDPKSTQLFAGRLTGDVTVNIYENAFHELHNEPEQEDYLGEIVDWIGKKI